MALYTPFKMSMTTALQIAEDLAKGNNVPKFMGCLCRAVGLNFEMLEAADLEKQVEKYIKDENIGYWAKIAAEKMKSIRTKAEAEKAAKEKKKTAKLVNNGENIGTKRKNEDRLKEEPLQKKVTVEEKASEVKEEKKKAKKATAVLNSSLIDPATELAKKLKDLPSKPTVSDAQKLIRSFGHITPTLLEDAEDLIGRKMRRVDEVWWLLLQINFGLPKTKSQMDVREVYAKEVENKRIGDEETAEMIMNRIMRKAEVTLKEKENVVKIAKVEKKVEIKAPEATVGQQTVQDKENQPLISSQELAAKLNALPHHLTPFEALKFLRSLGSYTGDLLEEAETLVGIKMKRVDEIWRAICFIKFGDRKGKATGIRELYKELMEKKKKIAN